MAYRTSGGQGVEMVGGSASLVMFDSAARFCLPEDWLGRGDLLVWAVEVCILLQQTGLYSYNKTGT